MDPTVLAVVFTNGSEHQEAINAAKSSGRVIFLFALRTPKQRQQRHFLASSESGRLITHKSLPRCVV